MKEKVYVPVLYSEGVEVQILQEICAGLEEEGVPFFCIAAAGEGAVQLGRQAAFMSPLQVGIGVDVTGTYVIHHEKLTHRSPYIIERRGNERVVGQNAARLVKGLPLLHNKKG
jgi:hypothetical protein